MFKIKYSQTAVLNSGKLFSWLPGVNYALEHTFTNPWVFLFLTLTFGFIGGTIIFKTIPVELLVPYMYRELSRLRECVCKCSTKKQFLEYTDAEHNVKTLEDLRKLLIRAKTILGDVDLLLADDILKGISESAPGIQNQNGNNSVVQTATTTNL
jgi:hypothetical protein